MVIGYIAFFFFIYGYIAYLLCLDQNEFDFELMIIEPAFAWSQFFF
jgi:hypothetical protein